MNGTIRPLVNPISISSIVKEVYIFFWVDSNSFNEAFFRLSRASIEVFGSNKLKNIPPIDKIVSIKNPVSKVSK